MQQEEEEEERRPPLPHLELIAMQQPLYLACWLSLAFNSFCPSSMISKRELVSANIYLNMEIDQDEMLV